MLPKKISTECEKFSWEPGHQPEMKQIGTNRHRVVLSINQDIDDWFEFKIIDCWWQTKSESEVELLSKLKRLGTADQLPLDVTFPIDSYSKQTTWSTIPVAELYLTVRLRNGTSIVLSCF